MPSYKSNNDTKKCDPFWVGEYSAKQNEFHIDTIDRCLEFHREAAITEDFTGWELIAIGTYDEVISVMVYMRDMHLINKSKFNTKQ
jgi:hypothetical protein